MTRATVRLGDRAATMALEARLAGLVRGGDAVALTGDLGAGKTTLTLVTGLVAALGGGSAASPTFSLVNEYPAGRLVVWHVDLYRIERAAELPELGLDDVIGDPRGICVVEWADRFAVLPADHLRIELAHAQADDSRTVAAIGSGPRARRRAASLGPGGSLMRSAALVIAIVAWSAPARAERKSFDPASVYNVPRGQSPASGPVDAPVTIVAWSDYQCGYCNRVQATLDHLARLYPGQLRWVHRTMPLDDENTMVSEAALAADAQGRFLPMNDRLYALGGRVDRPTVELLVHELGLDLVRFRADLDSHAFRPAIDADMADARTLGVAGTPTFFINGRALFGNQPLPVFVDVFEQELARAAAQHGGYDALVATGKPTADAPSTTSNAQHPLVPTATYRIGLGLPGHQIGPDNALLTIVVWSDFQCPYCAKQAPVLAELRAKYKDEIRVVYRHLAMGFHRDAALAAEAAVAAAEQGKFWAFHDQVFANFGHLARADLEHYAEAIGLDLPVFRAALDQHRYRDAIVAEGAAGEALGIDGTPTMFLNGSPVIGARTTAVIAPLVEAHLARAREITSAGVPLAEFYAMLMTGGVNDDRADPSRVPVPVTVHVEPRSDDRVRGVTAACRRRDAARATQLAGPLAGDARRRATLVCSGAGIDLPPGK